MGALGYVPREDEYNGLSSPNAEASTPQINTDTPDGGSDEVILARFHSVTGFTKSVESIRRHLEQDLTPAEKRAKEERRAALRGAANGDVLKDDPPPRSRRRAS